VHVELVSRSCGRSRRLGRTAPPLPRQRMAPRGALHCRNRLRERTRSTQEQQQLASCRSDAPRGQEVPMSARTFAKIAHNAPLSTETGPAELGTSAGGEPVETVRRAGTLYEEPSGLGRSTERPSRRYRVFATPHDASNSPGSGIAIGAVTTGSWASRASVADAVSMGSSR
jgi:hypothetical protein